MPRAPVVRRRRTQLTERLWLEAEQREVSAGADVAADDVGHAVLVVIAVEAVAEPRLDRKRPAATADEIDRRRAHDRERVVAVDREVQVLVAERRVCFADTRGEREDR